MKMMMSHCSNIITPSISGFSKYKKETNWLRPRHWLTLITHTRTHTVHQSPDQTLFNFSFSAVSLLSAESRGLKPEGSLLPGPFVFYRSFNNLAETASVLCSSFTASNAPPLICHKAALSLLLPWLLLLLQRRSDEKKWPLI